VLANLGRIQGQIEKAGGAKFDTNTIRRKREKKEKMTSKEGVSSRKLGICYWIRMDGDMRQFNLAEWSILVIHEHTLHGVESRVGTIDDFAEYCVLGVEMRLLGIGDEELGFVRIWSGVCHSHYSTCIELQSGPQFICKGPTPDTLAAFS